MKREAGFTIVELMITVTIMVMLLILTVVSLRGTQAQARDEERKTDVSNIGLYLENLYRSGTSTHPEYKGSYPPVSAVSNTANIETWFDKIDIINLRAPGVTDATYSLVPATSSNQTTAAVQPQPTVSSYVYQPINQSGGLCTVQAECRKFNIHYKQENDASVVVITSKNQ